MKKAGFKKGQKVRKIFSGLNGYTEESTGVVTKVSKGVAYVDEGTGITFDAVTGREIENFFPGMSQRIEAL